MPPRQSLALLALAVSVPLPALAFVRSEVPDEPGVYQVWPDRAVVLRPSADEGAGIAPDLLRAAVERSAAVWSAPACTDLVLSVGDDATGTETNLIGDLVPDLENRVVWRSDWPDDLGQDAAAITTLLVQTTGDIVDADVDLNELGFVWSVADRPEDAVDLESNLTHELGHVIGFDHSRDDEATMYFSTRRGDVSRRDLATTDVDGLCFVYPAGAPSPSDTVEEDVPPDDDDGGCSVAPGRGSGVALFALVLLASGMVSARRGRRRSRAPDRPTRADSS